MGDPNAGDLTTEDEAEPQLQLGLWRNAQATDGTEAPTEATPEISVLFRLGSAIMPSAKPFSEDDGGLVIGAFSGLVEPPPAVAEAPAASEQTVEKVPDTIVMAKVAVPLPPPPGAVRIPPVAVKPVPPKSPLVGTVTSEKEMKCLAEAVYFEARSEPERGQAGVAQVVVLNRVAPASIHRRSAAWSTRTVTAISPASSLRLRGQVPQDHRARPLGNGAAHRPRRAEGRTYLPGVGNATHYHANYVRPWWARHMEKRERVGSHIFYFESAEN